MNRKIKQLISELADNLKQASRTITWDTVAMQGYDLAIEAATIGIANVLAERDNIQTTLVTSAEGLTIEATQYTFSVAELENVMMHAFNIGAASTAKPRAADNKTWAERGF